MVKNCRLLYRLPLSMNLWPFHNRRNIIRVNGNGSYRSVPCDANISTLAKSLYIEVTIAYLYMAQVTLDDITKIYDDRQGTELAVENLDLKIHDGEFLVLLGPSGCGKSTTLRMLAGLESVTDGSIQLDGQRINDVKPKNRNIAMVFQNYALYPHKTVEENMGIGLKIQSNLNDDEVQRRVNEAAEMMGIDDLLQKQPSALSGGQQQRVATGRAIVREPAVFLFDEPLSNLDAKLRKHMRTELARIHSELEITSVYVTHDQEEAMTLGDRIAIMNNGRLQQVGTPLEVYNNPTNAFVADFIGSPSTNMLSVDLERQDDETGQLVGEGFSYPISQSLATQIRDETESSLLLGIRPERATVVDDGPISATVDVVETLGSDNYIYLDLDGKEFRIRSNAENKPPEDERVDIDFEERDIFLFDADSGRNIREQTQEKRHEIPS